jgi:hypothetical protein
MIYLFQTLRRAHTANGAEAAKGADPSQVIAELRRVVEQVGQDLSARSSALEQQVEALDRRGDRLESLIARPADRLPSSWPEPRSESPTVQPPVTAPPPRQQAPPQTEPAPAQTQRPAAVEPSPASPEEPPPAGSPVGFRPSELHDAERYQQVFALAEQGLSSLEISRRTRVGREEVELLLGLRENGGSTPQS